MGPGCELSTGLVASLGAGVAGVLCLSCVVGVVISMWRTKTVVVTMVKPPVEHVALSVAAKSVLARPNHHEVISL